MSGHGLAGNPVPDNWDVVPAGYLFRREKRTGAESEQLLSVYRDYGVIPKDSRDDNFNKASEDLSAYQLVEPSDLVINKMKAWQGSVGVSEHRGIVSPAYFVASPTRDFNRRYVHYLLRCSDYLVEYQTRSAGIRVNQWDLDWEDFRRIPVTLPPPELQESIANFLDEQTSRIDALIAEKERLAATLNESEASQILALVTGRMHGARAELDPHAPDERVLAHAWELPQLARLVSKLTNGYVGPTRDILVAEGVRYLQSLHIKDGQIEFARGEYYVAEEWSLQHAKSILAEGDVLIVQTGDIGQTALVTEDFVGCNCHALIIATPRKELVDPRFLELALRSAYGRAAFDLYATGALHPHLNCSNIRDIRIPKPPLPVQEDIVRRARAVQDAHRELTEHVEGHVQRLREYRSSLISASVTGQVDISTFKAEA